MKKLFYTTLAASVLLSVGTAYSKKMSLEDVRNDPYSSLIMYAIDAEDSAARDLAVDLALKANKDNPIALHSMVVREFQRGDTVSARKWAEKMVKATEGTEFSGDAYLAYASAWNADNDKLVSALMKASADENTASTAYLRLAAHYLTAKNNEKAYQFADNLLAVTDNPGHVKALLDMIDVTDPYYDKVFNKALEMSDNDRDSAGYYDTKACDMIFRNISDEQDTIPTTTIIGNAITSFRLHPGELPASFEFLLSMQPEATISCVKSQIVAANDSASQAELLFLLSRLYLYNNDYPNLLESTLRYKGVTKTDDSDLLEALALYGVNDYPAALPLMEKVRNEHDEDLMSEIFAETLGSLSRFDEAITVYDKVIDYDGDEPNPEHLIGRARIEMAQQKFHEAATDYADALEAIGDPLFIPAALCLGDALANLGDEANARITWQKALDAITDDNREEMTNELWVSLLLAALGRTDEAQKLTDEVLQSPDPELYNAACYYTRIGNKKLALDYLAKALDADSDPYHAEIDYDLRPLRDEPEYKTMVAKAKDKLTKHTGEIRRRAQTPLIP